MHLLSQVFHRGQFVEELPRTPFPDGDVVGTVRMEVFGYIESVQFVVELPVGSIVHVLVCHLNPVHGHRDVHIYRLCVLQHFEDREHVGHGCGCGPEITGGEPPGIEPFHQFPYEGLV